MEFQERLWMKIKKSDLTRFAKYAKENIGVDLDSGEIQDIQNILNAIIDCCEENHWFE